MVTRPTITPFAHKLFTYWNAELEKDARVYHVNGEMNLTLMAEDAIEHFKIDGIEQDEIHEATVDFITTTNWY